MSPPKPKILFFNCRVAEEISATLGEDWLCEKIEKLEETENFHAKDNSLCVLTTTKEDSFNDWCLRNMEITTFFVHQLDEEHFPPHVTDWIRWPAKQNELTARLQHHHSQWQDYSHLLKFSKKMTHQRNVQSEINDRLLKTTVELKVAKDEIEELSLTDSLTGARNRRYFDIQVERDVLQASRYKTPLSVYMLDIDDFKATNDTYGHPYGDKVLIKLIDIVMANLRDTDWVARYGGEEFFIILPMTDFDGALKSANRIRESMEESLSEKKDDLITVSVGLCTFHPDTMDVQSFIKSVDDALYHSKRNGKNKVSYFNPLTREFHESSSGKIKSVPKN